ncbi:MAG: TlyA family RNA methyltransferase [Cyanobacteria bacterium P01_A01_bin.114]
MAKQRLDMYLVESGLCESRQLAQRVIRAGEVQVNQVVIDKPGTLIKPDATVLVKQKSRFVSRGGEKLAKALEVFGVEVCDRICLDGGISTGGFTDCLLQAGARQVYGVDVGYGQVAWKLRQDPRVVLKERTNIRHLTQSDLYSETQPHPDLGVMDVSFISLTKVLPAFWALLAPPREAILLIKPQFEVGRDKIGKKGVVRDPRHHTEAIETVLNMSQHLGWQYRGLTWSPLVGPAGNIEYLLWLSAKATNETATPTTETIADIAKTARKTLQSPDL